MHGRTFGCGVVLAGLGLLSVGCGGSSGSGNGSGSLGEPFADSVNLNESGAVHFVQGLDHPLPPGVDFDTTLADFTVSDEVDFTIEPLVAAGATDLAVLQAASGFIMPADGAQFDYESTVTTTTDGQTGAPIVNEYSYSSTWQYGNVRLGTESIPAIVIQQVEYTAYTVVGDWIWRMEGETSPVSDSDDFFKVTKMEILMPVEMSQGDAYHHEFSVSGGDETVTGFMAWQVNEVGVSSPNGYDDAIRLKMRGSGGVEGEAVDSSWEIEGVEYIKSEYGTVYVNFENSSETTVDVMGSTMTISNIVHVETKLVDSTQPQAIDF